MRPLKGMPIRTLRTSKHTDPGTPSQQHRATPKGTAREYLYNAKRRMVYQTTVYGRPTDPEHMHYDRFRAARQLGFRSGLEVQLAKQLNDNHISFEYEGTTLRYTMPEEEKRLTPDFILPNFIVVEGKGAWDTADRKKVKLFRQQHPDIDYRMIFSRSLQRISKKSKTTYADVCRTLGIPFADKWIPAEWWREPLNLTSKAAIEKASIR